MRPLPTIPASCSLDEAGLAAQRERYAHVARHARRVERTPLRIEVELSAEVDEAVIRELIAVENDCCPFFQLAYRDARLEIAVDAEHEPALDAIEYALA